MANVMGENILANTRDDALVLNASESKAVVYSAMRMKVRDNTDFINKIDKEAIGEIAKRKTKTLVVGQDPEPGEFIPAGTPVNLTFIEKDDIPTGGMKVDEAIIEKYGNVGMFIEDLGKTGDENAEVAKNSMDAKKKYKDLSTNDKSKVDIFMKERFGDTATDSEEKKEKVYGDMMFMLLL